MRSLTKLFFRFARRSLPAFCLLAALALALPAPVRAADILSILPPSVVQRIEEKAGGDINITSLLSNIGVENFRTVGTTRSGTLKIFNATIPASFDSATDIVEFSIEGTDISFRGDVDDLDNFVEANAAAILRALFPNLDGAFAGTSASQRGASNFAQNVALPLVEPRSRTRRRKEEKKKALEQAKKDAKSADEKKEIEEKIQVLGFASRDLAGVLGFDRIEVGTDKASGNHFSAVFGHHSERENWEWGILVPYSFTNLDNAIQTDTHSLEGNLYFSIFALKAPVVLKIGASLIGSLTAIDTNLGVGGFLRYGGGPFASIEKTFGPVTVGTTVGFQVTKVNIPVVQDEFVDALNDRAADKELFYGGRIGYQGENFAVNIGGIRTSNFSSDVPDEFADSTTFFASLSIYFTDTFELTAGYRKIFEVKDFTSDGVFLGFIYRF